MKRLAAIGVLLAFGCSGVASSLPAWLPGAEPPPPVVHAPAAAGAVVVMYATDATAGADMDWGTLVTGLELWCTARGIAFRDQVGASGAMEISTDAGVIVVSIDEASQKFASRGIVLAFPGKNVMYVSYSPLDKVTPVAAEYFGVDP